jgi:hypothetical protein
MATCYAQRNVEHKGFYFSVGGGPAKGNINGYDNTGGRAAISGTGTELNFQIGGAFLWHWVAHAMYDVKYLSSPVINRARTSHYLSVNEYIFGIGLTRYTPSNFFLTGNMGTGNFSFSDQRHKESTKNGFSFLVKAGKEFRVSPHFAFGVAVTYNQTKLTNPSSIGITEKWNSNRFGILLQGTLN